MICNLEEPYLEGTKGVETDSCESGMVARKLLDGDARRRCDWGFQGRLYKEKLRSLLKDQGGVGQRKCWEGGNGGREKGLFCSHEKVPCSPPTRGVIDQRQMVPRWYSLESSIQVCDETSTDSHELFSVEDRAQQGD